MVKFWISSLIIILVLPNWWFCNGCLDEERFALLQLKSSVNYPNGNSLPLWREDDKSTCEWPNVVCNTTTKHVVQISLESTETWKLVQSDWHFNASLFLPFKMLRALSLASNGLVGWVQNQGFEKLSELSNLEVLNLWGNNFNHSVLSWLSHLTSIKTLNLGHNHLEGRSSHERLSNLKRLEFLSLDGIGISDFESVCSINDFTNLKVLDISQNTFQSFGPMQGLLNLKMLKAYSNRFDNSIFSSLKQFPPLKFLDLSDNEAIKGSVEMNELPALIELYLMGTGVDNIVTNQGLPNLEILHLGNSGFNNSIFSSLKHHPSLRFLDLSFNNAINGSIQVNELPALEELDLTGNGISSFVTTKGIANVSHLQVLHLDQLDASISNFSNLLPSLTVFSSLKTLYFQYNSFLDTHDWKNLSKLENLILDGTNHVDKNILNNIGGLLSLKVISLSECGLSGDLPNQGWCELKNLQELRLSKNELNGMLPSCLGNLTSIRLIDLSTNQFYGNIAISPLYKLTSLESLTISNNHFQVPFSFESFSNHSNLKFILAANNEVISETSVKNIFPSYKLEFFSLSNCVGQYHPRLPSFLLHQNELRILDLSHNNVGGDFPVWLLENNTKLEGFYMGGNVFNGDLKFPQKPNIHIGTVDISMNNISGQIPKDINIVFPNIVVLNMSWNNLVGSLPSSFCGLNSLAYLDLSNNNLTGELPKELATSCLSLQYLKLSNNSFQGQIIFPGALNTYHLSVLQLDNNNFVGTIPDNLSTIFVTLQALDLSNNHLYGELPKCLGNMVNLIVLSLSNNLLEGPIPIELCKLDGIKLLDMSENRLSGSIPSCFNPEGLKHLHLRKNLFGGQLTRAFFNMPSLVTLDLRNNKFRGRIPKWISKLRELNILLLQGNYFEGIIPSQLCQLSELSMLDLSYNNLSGSIPGCLDKMTLAMLFFDFNKASTIEVASSPMTWAILSYLKTTKLATTFHLPLAVIYDDFYPLTDGHVTAEFTSKLLSHSYKGIVLQYMSAVDLSCNQLSGNIPLNLGNLSEIRALNFSHNNLTGPIPTTLSGLVKVESLDLSYNMLNGRIPAQLVKLNFLEIFIVAHNNLSGPIPESKAQFATFDNSSYEGNALLCGPPLSNLCTHNNEPPPAPQVLLPDKDNGKEESNFMDLESFYISFVVSYIVMLLTVIAVLCINPYWRRTLFGIIGF
ncbi:PREDICTED: LRR receptor-like serine/threonine-protein kinase GSO1 isoform X3 [Ipomoea nil]|uniref:LRR receptor-like serine/threonine-protein kinase GSO1 isoform X3 n=1 Tax=Ipomoea nil TaxID=35883 RepID=UPI00090176F3|nr:PREDICTED: LRR receptor-like serine/threonine-protein kinase GSO1 isoform X3 [Ipomoea nil]